MSQIPDYQSVAPADPDMNFSDWHSATGPLAIPMTNDYLFRILLQRNNYVLKGLICSLLHLTLSDIKSAVINNPVIPGETINDKTFFLDISITLNDSTLINLEMQVINEHNWPERSLSYLCRTYDNLNSGENYNSVKSAVQIGILDFTLFPENPEFYSTYQFINVKNHTIYSDKVQLSVLNLTRIDLASEEDRVWGLDQWASLFKSGTWEELKMLARNNEFINEASATTYQLTQDEYIRMQCEAREDYYRRQRSVQSMIEEQEHTIRQLESENASLQSINTSLENKNTSLQSTNASLESKNTFLENQKISLQNENTALQKQLADALALINSIKNKM